MANFKKVGALWTTKSGKGFSGKLSEDVAEGQRLFLGENKKTKDNQPDMQLFVIEEENENPEPKGTMVDESSEVPF